MQQQLKPSSRQQQAYHKIEFSLHCYSVIQDGEERNPNITAQDN